MFHGDALQNLNFLYCFYPTSHNDATRSLVFSYPSLFLSPTNALRGCVQQASGTEGTRQAGVQSSSASLFGDYSQHHVLIKTQPHSSALLRKGGAEGELGTRPRVAIVLRCGILHKSAAFFAEVMQGVLMFV